LNFNHKPEELHRLFQQITESISEHSIVLLDEHGTILTWNKGAEKIKGYKADEIIGQHIRIFYLPEDRQIKLPETLLKEAADKGHAYFVGRRIRKNGTIFWGRIEITAIKDENGKVIGYTKLASEFSGSSVLDNFWFDTDGVLHTQASYQPYTPEKLAEFQTILRSAAGEQKLCCIADLRDCELTEIGNSFVQPDISEIYKAIAFVTDERMDLNTSSVLSKIAAAIPTKVFQKRAEAKEWIKQYL
jgi:PAS domain S-box-containing protein